MILPLPLAPGPDAPPAGEAWAAFVARRESLADQMEMATCNGCDGCGLRCADGFGVTREEYEAAREYVASRPAAEVARVAAQAKIIAWPGAEDTGATFAVCRYRDRDRNNCSIYPARPTICRLFGHTSWLPCPIEAVSQYPDGSAALWNDYRRRDRRTWDEWDQEFAEGGGKEGIPKNHGEP